ncbi:helix-turn-helix domain-containing protein [Chondromyces crocatus]|uniref:AraC family transcriptional regulator n=1 Tax=Chondromyces crocatus TaxID=52 RepID=A0A0K1EG93_CHOCO|nr:AraC family transcriptional regulator [Chondromyces crocatus]AKT39588.1 AraC family transcriptional regulator [Chondromyces crocatus]
METTTSSSALRDPPPPEARIDHFRPEGLDGVRVIRVVGETQIQTTFTEGYSLVAIHGGCFEDLYRRRKRLRRAGDLKLKEPGEVHRDLRILAPFSLQVAVVAPRLVEEAALALGLRTPVQFLSEPRHDHELARRCVFALHEALADETTDPFTRETRLTEAITEVVAAYAEGTKAPTQDPVPRAVRRAREYLHETFADKITLDTLAEHGGMDKFHLVRAFREALGVPPYEYLTHLRVARAASLLVAGVAPREVAQTVGLYDESQLHRHFRRIMRTTPGRYAAAHRVPRRSGANALRP